NSHLGSMTITDTTISGNSANYGGGIYNAGTLDATNVTISGNSATQDGGGIFDGTNYYLATAVLSLRNCSVSQNSAALGGGLFVSAGSAFPNNSIIAGNYNSGFGSPVTPDVSGLLGALITPKYCLIGSNLGSGLAEAPLGSPDANGNLIGGSLH